MSKVAVLMQAYNTEKYLPKAVDSILNQTHKDLVLYLADDNSSDETAEVIREYARKDSRVVPFYSSVNKYRQLMNDLLDELSKTDIEYLCYLDSDDWLDYNFIEIAMRGMEEADVDLAVGGMRTWGEASGEVINRLEGDVLAHTDDEHKTAFSKMALHLRSAHSKLYRFSIIKEHNIRYIPGVIFAEDTAFVFTYLKHARGVQVRSDISYNVLSRKGSVSRSAKPEMFESYLVGYDKIIDFLKHKNIETEDTIESAAYLFVLAVFDISILILAGGTSPDRKLEKLVPVFSHPLTAKYIKLIEKSAVKIHADAVYDMRKFILSNLLYMPAKLHEQVFSVLEMLVPDEVARLTEAQFKKLFSKHKELLHSFLLKDYDSIAEVFVQLSDVFAIPSKKGKAVMPVKMDSAYTPLLSVLAEQDEVMCHVLNRESLVNWPSIVSAVWKKEYEKARKTATDIILASFDKEPDKILPLIDLCVRLSALGRDVNSFLFCKKVLATYYYNRMNRENFDKECVAIEEILPDDPDVLHMREAWDLA